MSTADQVILNQLKQLINDLKAPISISKAIANNIQTIEQLKEYGIGNEYLAKTLSEQSGKEIKLTSFKTILHRLKKQGTPKRRLKLEITAGEAEGKITQTPIAEWTEIGVTAVRLIDDLISFGLTPAEVYEWGCANDVQRRKKLTELTVKKSRAL